MAPMSMHQDQFLDVLDRDEAERRYHAVIHPFPLGEEVVALAASLGRVLARDVAAPVDVPSFDRANVDGFAVRAEETYGASEEKPAQLRPHAMAVGMGEETRTTLEPGMAMAVATGAMLPRGADAVVMIEDTEPAGGRLLIRRPVAPGTHVTFAGTDVCRGEIVLHVGDALTARETGVLAAIGVPEVTVFKRPRVAILSTGNELIPPGAPMRPGLVYDSNATILADAVREIGADPVPMGIIRDDPAALMAKLQEAVRHDVVLLSGGTSKGAGDVCYQVIAQLGPPGIIVHGVALKPGKPICLAAVRRTGDGAQGSSLVPVIVLPGFPTSAIFTFHEFVAPILRLLAGRPREKPAHVQAIMPARVNSERGRTEYLLVGLVEQPASTPPPTPTVAGAGDCGPGSLAAYPMGKGSGSVTTYSMADGFVTIPRHREYLEAGEVVAVQLLGRGLRLADLVVMGSHCLGLDYLLSQLHRQGVRCKFLAVGSTGGLAAARRGECDVAGMHLFDPATGEYNRPFLGADLDLVPGYKRMQGVAFRKNDPRFEGKSVREALATALGDPHCTLVNRNRGSGTRVLLDELLGAARPPGFAVEARSHVAVAAAIAQGRADWGVCIATAAADNLLGFIPLRPEHFDFAIPRARRQRPAVQAFVSLLRDDSIRNALANMGLPP